MGRSYRHSSSASRFTAGAAGFLTLRRVNDLIGSGEVIAGRTARIHRRYPSFSRCRSPAWQCPVRSPVESRVQNLKIARVMNSRRTPLLAWMV
jgi:hypothetical protein